MRTLRTALAVPTLLLSLSAFAEDGAKDETRAVADFEGVEISHGMKAQVTVGPKSVRLSGENLSQVRTEVEDGKLVVRVEKKSWQSSSQGVRVFISTPKLTHVGASGGAQVEAEATTTDTFTAEVSGGGGLSLKNLDARKLSVDVSGGSEVTLKGRAESLELEASGGAQVHGKELSLKSLNVEASGGAEIEANPSERIAAELSGGSSVEVESSPTQREVSSSGGARVHFRGKK